MQLGRRRTIKPSELLAGLVAPAFGGPSHHPKDLHGRAIPGYDTDGVAIGSYSPPHTAELRNKGKREGEDEQAVAPAPAYRGAASYRAAHPTDQPLVYGRRLSQAKEAKQSEEEALLAAARRKDKDALDALRSMSPEGKSRSPPLLSLDARLRLADRQACAWPATARPAPV